MVVIITNFCPSVASIKLSRRIYHIEISRSPSPTTTSPITAPDLKATLSPPFNDFLDAFAVLADAYVAVFIPINPASPEKNPPVRNANGTHSFWTPKP